MHTNIFRKVIKFFDKLEDKVRGTLSRRPLLYTFIGGVAIVLFWRGVWMTADLIPFLSGPISVAISVGILMVTGLFVSFFVSDRIILSGIKQEKKFVEKTENEIKAETTVLEDIRKDIRHIEKEIGALEKKVDGGDGAHFSGRV